MWKNILGGGGGSGKSRFSSSSSSKEPSDKRGSPGLSSSTNGKSSGRGFRLSRKNSSKASSVSRDEDRERERDRGPGIGDVDPYPPSSSRSRFRDSRGDRALERRRDRDWDVPEPLPRSLGDDSSERSRPQADVHLPPLDTGAGHFGADIASPGFSQFPMQYDNGNNNNTPNFTNPPPMPPPSSMPGHHEPNHSPATYDPHVPQQFPGQFPAFSTEPYRPSNPNGEAADYYGDQGQSVQHQPGVRPTPPPVIPNDQAHLMPASPAVNPPPEPSSMGTVGSAADYYSLTPEASDQEQPESPRPPGVGPPGPSRPSGLSRPPPPNGVPAASYHASPQSPPGPMDPKPAGFHPNSPPPSHSMEPAIGAAAGGAAAGSLINHHHSSSSPEHPGQPPYGMPNNEPNSPNGLGGPSLYPSYPAGYAAHPSHPDHQVIYHSSPFQSAPLAFQQRQRGPLDKFIDFWKDPEGVGKFEEYTETIGICKYCFEPGTSSRDAPRKHNYRPPRRSSDRYSNDSRVDKSLRYSSSSDDESRRKSSSKRSWFGGLWSGAAVKSFFDSKDFEDSYNLRPSRVSSPVVTSDSESESDRTKRFPRGRRSPRNRSPALAERKSNGGPKRGKWEGRRSRSRSTSSSAVRNIVLGAAVGSAAAGASSHWRSPKKSKSRAEPSESSSSSYLDISRQSQSKGLGSFFTSSSENQKKRKPRRQRSFFSLQNSSSSSLDNDLAFGNGYTRKPNKTRKGKGKEDDNEDVDAKLAELTTAATALADYPDGPGKGYRRGQVRAGKDSRPRQSGYGSAGTTDGDWESVGSDSQSSSVSSALAFGGSSGSGDDSSDSGTSKWSWRWRNKKDKKKQQPKEKDNSPDRRSATGSLFAAGAAALGTAALASGYREEGRDTTSGSSSPESLQRLVPMSTSDPSRFDAVQPAYVRPGPIPLQQPQPVTPVSQAVYSSQGESIPANSAPTGPPFFGAPRPYSYPPPMTNGDSRARDDSYPERSDVPADVKRPGLCRRSDDGLTVMHPEASEVSTSTRRSVPKDQASVSFNLTEEQAEKERRADRRERKKRDSRQDYGIQLVDHEDDEPEHRDQRRERENEKRRRDRSVSRRDAERERRRQGDQREKDSSSLIDAAAVGTIGAASASSLMSHKINEDPEICRRRKERRERLHAERRRMMEQAAETPNQDRVDPVQFGIENPAPRDNQPDPVRSPGSRVSSQQQRDDYAAFFAPHDLRDDRGSRAQSREPISMPAVDEAPPAAPSYASMPPEPEPPQANYGGLPWLVPQLNLIEPTPPQSQNGSVRDITSPIPPSQEPPRPEPRSERDTIVSRVSWGDPQTHEYSDYSEHESVDHDMSSREVPRDDVLSKQPTVEDAADDGIDFAATVAAGTAAAGFDPSVVTDNDSFRRRSSPPETGHREFSDYTPSWQASLPQHNRNGNGTHGYVEGEVGTPEETDIDSKNAPEVELDRQQFLEQEPEVPVLDKRSPDQGETSRELPVTNDEIAMPGSFEAPSEPTATPRDGDVSSGPVNPEEREDTKVDKEQRKDPKKRLSRIPRSKSGQLDYRDSVEGDEYGRGADVKDRKDPDSEPESEFENVQRPSTPVKNYASSSLDASDSRTRSRSVSLPSSAKTVDMGAQQPRGRRLSTPETTPETDRQTRRSPALQEPPSVVRLHSRRPPSSSPRRQRTPSDSSTRERALSESPGSPTQKRPRRPSTEFEPMYLVEQYGGKREPQQQQQQQEEEAMDEQLPPLPSSKGSSGTPSEVSELRDLPDGKNWEMVDLSRDVLPEEPLAELDPAASTPSDRTIPTRETIDNNNDEVQPGLSIKKGMPMYELHSPFELLRDPRAFMLFPPSPATEGPPPAYQGHDFKEPGDDYVDDFIAPRSGPGAEAKVENVPLPESGLSTPGDKEIPNPVPGEAEMSSLPGDDRSLVGSGFDAPSEAGESRMQDGARYILAYGAEKIALPESGPPIDGAGAESIPLPESGTVTPKDREIPFEEAEMAPAPVQNKSFALPTLLHALKETVGAGDMNVPREDIRDVPTYGAENVPLPESGTVTPKGRELPTKAEMTPTPLQHMAFDSPVEPSHKDTKDVLAYGAEKIPLPDSGLSTPKDRDLPSKEAEMTPIPAQDKSIAWPEVPGVDGAEGAGWQKNIDSTPVQGAENTTLPESGLSTPLDREVPFEDAEMAPPAHDTSDLRPVKTPQDHMEDALAHGAETVPFSNSGPATPMDREIPFGDDTMKTTPAQEKTSNAGIVGVVGAVAAAMGAGESAASPNVGSRELGQDVGPDVGSTTPLKEEIVPTIPEVPVESAPSVKEGDVLTIPEVPVPTTTTEGQETAAPDENAREMEQDPPDFESMQPIGDTIPSVSVSASEQEAQEPHSPASMGFPSIVDPEVAADLGFVGAKPAEEVEDYDFRESPFENDYLLPEEGEEFQPTALSPIDEESEPDEVGWERSFGGSGMMTPQMQPEEATDGFATPEPSSKEMVREPAVEQWERIPEQEPAAEQEEEFAPVEEPIVGGNTPEPESKPEHEETPTCEVEPTAAAPEAERVPEIAETSKELESAYPAEASEAPSSTQPEHDAGSVSEDQFREPTGLDIPEDLAAPTEPVTTVAEPTTQPAADDSKPLEKPVLPTIEELSEPVEGGQERAPPPEPVENAGDGTRELLPEPKDELPGMTAGTEHAITQKSPDPSEAPTATTENDGSFKDLEAPAADADTHFAGQENPESTSHQSLPEKTEADNASTSEPTVRTAESVAPSEDSFETAHDDAPTPKQTPKQEASDPFSQVTPLEPEELAQAVDVSAAGQDAFRDVPVGNQPEIKAEPHEQPHEQAVEALIEAEKIPHDAQPEARDTAPPEASMPTDTAETIAEPAEDGHPTSADPEPEALSRKGSKNKKKNKRESATEQSIPSEQTASVPTEQRPDEGQPDAQLTPVDLAETPQTSGEMSPATGEDQPPAAAPPPTSEEPAGAHPDVEPALAASAAAAAAAAGSESNPPPVGQPEANDATPHALAQPAERAITPTDTHDAPLPTFPETVSTGDPYTDTGDVNAIAFTQEPLSSITTTTPAPEPSTEDKEASENMSRTDLSEAPEHQDATQVENAPMTPAPKEKATKDKGKRRNASVNETAPSEPDSIQEAEGLLPVGGTLSTIEAPAVQQPEIVPEHPKDDGTADVEPVQPSSTTEDTETGTLRRTGEDPVAETEPTQEDIDQTDRIVDVDTTAASHKPVVADTKPTEEFESHPPATVEPPKTTSSDPAPETPRDEPAVGTDVGALTANPVVTESVPEGGQFGNGAADVAPAQDRGHGDATVTESAEETASERGAPLQDNVPAVASEAEQSTEAPLAEPMEDRPTEPIVSEAAKQKPDKVSAQPDLKDPSATTEESQIIDSYLETAVEPGQAKSERKIPNDDAAKDAGIAQGEPVEQTHDSEKKLEQPPVPENLQTQPEVISEPAVSDQPPAASEPQSPVVERAPVNSSSKSKKNRKKHKRKTSEASSVASEPSQAESDKPFDVGMPGGEPEPAASEPRETESLASSEVKEEKDTHPEDYDEDTHMSAKARRNAKKHRKRHSRELHAAEAQHWAEEHKSAEPSLETPAAPAEDRPQEHSREITENDNQTRVEPAGQGQDIGAFKADGTTASPDESHVFDWGNLAASAFGKAKDGTKTQDVPVEVRQPEVPLTTNSAEPASSERETTPAVEQPAKAEVAPSMEESAKEVPEVPVSAEQPVQPAPEPVDVSRDIPVPAPSVEQRDVSTEGTGLETRGIEPQADLNAPADTAEVETSKDATTSEPVPDSGPHTGTEEPALTSTNELPEVKVDDEMTTERAVPEPEGLPSQKQSSEHFSPTTEPAVPEELPSTHEQPIEHPRDSADFASTTGPVAGIEAGTLEDMIPESVPLPGSPLEEPSDKQLPEIDEQIPPIEGVTAGEPETPISPGKPTSPEPLSRKASKKQRKKAKKHAKKEHEEPASPASVEKPIPDARTTASVAPEQPVKKQVEGTQPAILVDTQTEAPTGLSEGREQHITTDTQDEPKAEQEQAGPSEDPADRQPESKILRRLSQREKRKAKEARESMESVEQPQQPETQASASTEPVGQPDKAEEQVGKGEFSQPQSVTGTPDTREPSSIDPSTGGVNEPAVQGVSGQENNQQGGFKRGIDTSTSKIEQEPDDDTAGRPEAVQGPGAQDDPESNPDSSQGMQTASRMLNRVTSIFPNLQRGGSRRSSSDKSLKDRADDETMDQEVSRDKDAALVSEAVNTSLNEREEGHIEPLSTPLLVEDPSFAASTTVEPETPTTPADVAIDVEVGNDYNVSIISDGSKKASRAIGMDTNLEEAGDESKHNSGHEVPLYAPVPRQEQSSVLVRSSLTGQREDSLSSELRRSPTIMYGRHEHTPRSCSLEDGPKTPPPPAPGPRSPVGAPSPPRTPVETTTEKEPEGRVEQRTVDSKRGTPRLEMKPEHVLPRPETPTPAGKSINNNSTMALGRPERPSPRKGDAIAKSASRPYSQSTDKLQQSPDLSKPILRPSRANSVPNTSPTATTTNINNLNNPRSLRRRTTRNISGDLRAASRALEKGKHAQPPPPSDLNLERIASSSSYDPVTDKGKRPLRSMTDVIEAWGETPSSPRSPSRPPSVRHRRSIQHLQDMETRLDQLISENRLLIAARDAAEDKLKKTTVARRKSDNALNQSDSDLRDREADVEQLRSSVEWFQKEITRLTEENEDLTSTNTDLNAAHQQEILAIRESSACQIEELRAQYQQATADTQDQVRREVDLALAQKNADLRRLREELESARDKVRRLQEEITASVRDDVVVFRDEEFFDVACRKLCGHVQQWVLRFSKHSDHRRCRRLSDLADDKFTDRFDNALLDGSDADAFLADRVRRRDVFMSVVMTMVWEFIFTRYLFGMDREQRQKLKSLEKHLSEVGPRGSVHRWRATTLSLLAKRPAFAKQREHDTEAVALEIFNTLSRLLPPPTQVENQLLESLHKVLRVAVSLSVEMRTQLAEYIMLPPLQPEYDANGEVTRFVYFNASLMNERSETVPNQDLEAYQTPVRMVLFPLVVKKGNDKGEGDDEVVVSPAQVVVSRSSKDKNIARMLSGDRMSVDTKGSMHSTAPSSNTMDMSNLI